MKRYKLVTIITKQVKDEGGAIVQREGLAVRVPRGLAQLQVDRGLAAFTSKGRYKHILAEQKKRERREAILEAKRRALKDKMQGKPKQVKKN